MYLLALNTTSKYDSYKLYDNMGNHLATFYQYANHTKVYFPMTARGNLKLIPSTSNRYVLDDGDDN